MNKFWKRFALAVGIVLLLVFFGGYFWLKSSIPQYSGEIQIHLNNPTSVYFDEYGIPHIEASNKHDAFKALGYVHAQERLFQMELLRRVGSGRLSEIIGKDGIKVDRVFRTLGVANYAKQCSINLTQSGDTALLNELNAYLNGVNEFIQNGPTPPEFALIGIEKSNLTIEDLYCITGAMSFGFSQANKTEPVITKIAMQYGNEYLKDLGLWHGSSESYIPNTGIPDTALINVFNLFNEAEKAMPVAPFNGSNSWAVSGTITESGKPLFCNDTHIGYGLPQTWFEAHVKYPNNEIHGHFLGGIPYALIGKTPHYSWGLTMLLNDDMDFYFEHFNPNNKEEVLYKNKYVSVTHRTEIIHVKGQSDLTLDVLETPHGPIINSGIHGFESNQAISCKWEFVQKKNKTIEAFRGLNQSKSFNEFLSYLPLIHSPGLSVNYADDSNNIAWVACA
ncbi:MAG: penicillin acylase family protein, partial [Bacteroidota bacterium]